jgi:TonB family protein
MKSAVGGGFRPAHPLWAGDELQPRGDRPTLPLMSHPAAMLRVQLTSLAVACLAWPGAAAGADFWDDRGVKVIQTVEMRFPPSLLLDGITEGQVRAVLEVDAEGALTDFLITGFTHPELAAELQRALSSFEFQAARQRGEPIGCRFETVFTFEARGAVISQSALGMARAQFRGTQAEPMVERLARMTELDEPLTVIHQVAPSHPGRKVSRSVASGTAQIDFYIDGHGRPRMPVVLRSSGDKFALAAIEALLQWRFAPPTREGRPVAVRVVQEFVFPATSPPQPRPK